MLNFLSGTDNISEQTLSSFSFFANLRRYVIALQTITKIIIFVCLLNTLFATNAFLQNLGINDLIFSEVACHHHWLFLFCLQF